MYFLKCPKKLHNLSIPRQHPPRRPGRRKIQSDPIIFAPAQHGDPIQREKFPENTFSSSKAILSSSTS